MSVFQLSILFSFLVVICWGCGDFFIQRTVRKLGDFKTLLWVNLVGGLGLTPFIIKDLPMIFIWPNLLSLIIMTVIQLAYGLFLFKAYNKGKLSVVEVVMIGELPVTIILGLIFFGERLSGWQLLMIITIILGIFLVSKTRPTWADKLRSFFTGQRRIWEKGVIFSIFAVLFSASYNFFTAFNSREISAFTAVWFPWLLSSLLLLIYAVAKEGFKPFWQESRRSFRLILITGILDTLGWLFYALALIKEELSIITAIVAGYAVVAMILGIKFNQEKINVWQYLGAIFILGGAITMCFLP
ncbi:MAG: DMT family transporter [bacterium]|nr:DMT family transporter [bacterium]